MSLGNEIRIGGVKAASETGSIRAPSVGGGSAMRSGTAMERGATGPMGPQGPKGDTGATGPAGADGVSVTHRWNGTVLEVTSASGTSSADLKGDPGTVTAVKVAGETHEPDDTGVVDLGQITGGADLSDDAPAPLGTAAAGTSELAARADHMHKMPTAAQVGAATAESVSQLKDDLAAEQTARAEGLAEKLGKTETAADSAKLGGKAPEYYIQPRNLLDNSDFTNPVNQRGVTSYSGIWVYGIDRWAAWLDASSPATVSVADGGITPYPGMVIQRIESKYIDSGKTYTLAAMTGDGLLVLSGKITSVTQTTTNSNNGISFEYNADSDTYQFVLCSLTSASKFVWAALYKGSYTADTLPPYVPKGYAVELAECQRYYQFIKSGFPIIGTSYTTSTSSANVRFLLPIKMRKNPAVTTDATQIGVVDKGNTPLASSATFSMSNNSLDMSLTFSSAVFEKPFISVSPYSAVDIQLSADL